jgi:hypothetical protein
MGPAPILAPSGVPAPLQASSGAAEPLPAAKPPRSPPGVAAGDSSKTLSGGNMTQHRLAAGRVVAAGDEACAPTSGAGPAAVSTAPRRPACGASPPDPVATPAGGGAGAPDCTFGSPGAAAVPAAHVNASCGTTGAVGPTFSAVETSGPCDVRRATGARQPLEPKPSSGGLRTLPPPPQLLPSPALRHSRFTAKGCLAAVRAAASPGGVGGATPELAAAALALLLAMPHPQSQPRAAALEAKPPEHAVTDDGAAAAGLSCAGAGATLRTAAPQGPAAAGPSRAARDGLSLPELPSQLCARGGASGPACTACLSPVAEHAAAASGHVALPAEQVS